MFKTLHVSAVAKLLADNPGTIYWAGDIAKATGVNQSALAGSQGILQRMVNNGYIVDTGWTKSTIRGGAPRRTYQAADVNKLRTLFR